MATIPQMRMPLAVFILALAAGCASARAPASARPNMTPDVLVDQNGRVYRTTDAAAIANFPTSADSTFRAFVTAYTTLGIEPSAVDPAARVVSRQHILFRSKFQGERLSVFFDCGAGQFGPRADDGRILADITSRVAANGAGAIVSTTVEASMTANDGVSRDPIRCVSQGKIEEELRREVSDRLGTPYRRNS